MRLLWLLQFLKGTVVEAVDTKRAAQHNMPTSEDCLVPVLQSCVPGAVASAPEVCSPPLSGH